MQAAAEGHGSLMFWVLVCGCQRSRQPYFLNGGVTDVNKAGWPSNSLHLSLSSKLDFVARRGQQQRFVEVVVFSKPYFKAIFLFAPTASWPMHCVKSLYFCLQPSQNFMRLQRPTRLTLQHPEFPLTACCFLFSKSFLWRPRLRRGAPRR